MGLFIALSGVIGADLTEVAAALSDLVANQDGIFRAEDRSPEDDDTLVLAGSSGNTSMLFPHNDFSWEDTSRALSQALKKAVFSFHIHDGDLWMYTLYQNGTKVDAFNPIPGYWDEDISDADREANKGNADVVCSCVPGLQRQQIEKYLVTWDLDDGDPPKAYADDEFSYGTDWQLIDFIKKLGLVYPIGDSAEPLGTTFQFKLPE